MGNCLCCCAKNEAVKASESWVVITKNDIVVLSEPEYSTSGSSNNVNETVSQAKETQQNAVEIQLMVDDGEKATDEVFESSVSIAQLENITDGNSISEQLVEQLSNISLAKETQQNAAEIQLMIGVGEKATHEVESSGSIAQLENITDENGCSKLLGEKLINISETKETQQNAMEIMQLMVGDGEKATDEVFESSVSIAQLENITDENGCSELLGEKLINISETKETQQNAMEIQLTAGDEEKATHEVESSVSIVQPEDVSDDNGCELKETSTSTIEGQDIVDKNNKESAAAYVLLENDLEKKLRVWRNVNEGVQPKPKSCISTMNCSDVAQGGDNVNEVGQVNNERASLENDVLEKKLRVWRNVKPKVNEENQTQPELCISVTNRSEADAKNDNVNVVGQVNEHASLENDLDEKLRVWRNVKPKVKEGNQSQQKPCISVTNCSEADAKNDINVVGQVNERASSKNDTLEKKLRVWRNVKPK